MPQGTRSDLRRYGVAVLAVLTALLLDLLVWPWTRPTAVPLFTVAVLFSSWYGGLGPGLLASALSALVGRYFFIEPFYVLTADGGVLTRLAIFAILAAATSYVTAAHRRSDTALREAQGRSRLMMENVRDHAIFMTDTQGNVASWDVGAERLLGYPGPEILGRPSSLFLTPEDARKGVLGRELATAEEVGKAEDERWLVRKDGTRFFAVSVVNSVRDEAGALRGYATVMRDITDQKQSQDALRESQARFFQLADNLPGGFIYQVVQSPDGPVSFSYVSGGVENIVGVPPGEVTADPAILYGRVVEEDLPGMRAAEDASIRERTPFDRQFRARGPDGDVRWLHCRAVPRRLEGGGSIWDGVALDVTAQKQAEGRQRLLAEAGRILGSSLDYEATLRDVCRLVVPEFADWCALDLLTDAGEVRRLDVAHVEPEKVEIAYTLWGRYPPGPDDERGLTNVLRTGVPEFYPDVSDELLARGARDEEHLRTLRNLGLRSAIIVPLTARGRTLGAMTLVTAETLRRYGEEDLRLALELGSRAALAVDNARLFSEGQAAARRLEETLHLHRTVEEQLTLLVEASGGLSDSPDLHSVLSAILALSRRLVAADAYAVWRHHAATVRWEIALASGLSEEYQQSAIRVLATTPDMTETPIIAEDVAASPYLGERERAYQREGIRSLLVVPLRVHGKTTGTLVFYYRSPHRFNEVEVRVGTALANLAGSAIGTAELYEELKEADRRKDEFLAMLAHELRNPLAAISNAVQVEKRSGPGEHHGWSLEVIEGQVRHLARMVDDLLDVSRITRGKIELRKRPLLLGPVVNSAVEAVRPLVDERKQTLRVDIEPGPVWVSGDPTRLEQVLVNLLNNAAKYTDSGGDISLNARSVGEEVVIRVRDTGLGMTPELLSRAFELFAQGDRSIARSEGGLGIGLTLVKTLVEMHGGIVTAESEGPGKGSRFTVRLPAVPEAPDEPARQDPPAVRAVQGSHRVLVVDDHVATARGMARLLKLQGHDVRVAHDGLTAIEEARSHRPRVIVLDIGLPGMDGYQVAATLRQEDWGRDALIIAVSGYGEEQAVRRSRESGFNHHLVKPVDFDTLATLIGRPE